MTLLTSSAHQEQTVDMVLGLGTRLETAAQGKVANKANDVCNCT